VTRKELVAAYALGKIDGCIVEDIMRPGVPQIPPDIPLAAAAHLMNDQGLRIFFLMHHAGGIEYPAAMITYEHILRHLASRSADDLRDLGIKAERESPVETFIKKRDAARRRSANDLESGDNHAC
jgi:CBS domain-containing protein